MNPGQWGSCISKVSGIDSRVNAILWFSTHKSRSVFIGFRDFFHFFGRFDAVAIYLRGILPLWLGLEGWVFFVAEFRWKWKLGDVFELMGVVELYFENYYVKRWKLRVGLGRKWNFWDYFVVWWVLESSNWESYFRDKIFNCGVCYSDWG